MIEGPFVLASGFSLADIATIPWLLRMDALEVYRGVEIPKTKEFEKIHEWIKSCKDRKSIQSTIPSWETQRFKRNKVLISLS